VKLVVGLGNPGQKYQRTRHNCGFLVIDRLAAQNSIKVATTRCEARIGEGLIDGERIVLAKPQTFMNRSGEAVTMLLRRFHVAVEDLVIVYDDLDLPFGRIRVRPQGRAGGHRGVASLIESLAGSSFDRVRVGIGRPPPEIEPADFVLQPFSKEEEPLLDGVISRAADAVACLVINGSKAAMDQFNRVT
jgi:peptidyl-tRNA hydrolase, PTH1 family